MTTILVLNLEGEDAIHSTWILDQDITQEQASKAFHGPNIWLGHPDPDPEMLETPDDVIIEAMLKSYGWTGKKVRLVEGAV